MEANLRHGTLHTAIFGAVLAICPLATSAQDAEAVRDRLRAVAETNPELGMQLRSLDQPERRTQFATTLIQELFRVDPNGRVTQDGIDLRKSKDLAKQRAHQFSRLLVWDLNADGQIDAGERRQFSGTEAAGVEVAFAEGDTNRDGTLSFDEIVALGEANGGRRGRQSLGNLLMVFDFDQDGAVTSQEITQTIDALGDEPLGLAELLQNRQRAIALNQRVQRQETDTRCDGPKPAPDSQFIVLSGYEGDALSTVALSGLDEVTKVATIEIEPGEAPLYLLVGTRETLIWEVTGAVERVAAFVAQGGGVVGLPKDKVHFVAKNGCFGYVSSVEGVKGALAYRTIEKRFGRAPNTMLARYTISRIAVPSGTAPENTGDGDGVDVLTLDGKRFEVTPEGLKPMDEARDQLPGQGPFGAARTMRSMLRFHGGGLREIDADDVVAAGKAEAYDVYPQEAGLLQLLLDGRLRYSRDGVYIVEQNIPRFPAGLFGAHSVKFMIAEGVEMPGGTPGHSSVISQDGDCLAGVCRR